MNQDQTIEIAFEKLSGRGNELGNFEGNGNETERIHFKWLSFLNFVHLIKLHSSQVSENFLPSVFLETFFPFRPAWTSFTLCCLLTIQLYSCRGLSCVPAYSIEIVYLHCIYDHWPSLEHGCLSNLNFLGIYSDINSAQLLSLSLSLPVLSSVITPHSSLCGHTNTDPFNSCPYVVLQPSMFLASPASGW